MGSYTRETYDNDGNVVKVETIEYDDAPVLKARAQKALDASDMTAMRCFKAGVVFPTAWKNYVSALRSIVSGGAGPLPARPDFPAGT